MNRTYQKFNSDNFDFVYKKYYEASCYTKDNNLKNMIKNRIKILPFR